MAVSHHDATPLISENSYTTTVDATLDSLRVLEEAGAKAPSYATVKRRLGVYATGRGATGADEGTAGDAGGVEVEGGAWPELDAAGGPWRARLARACADHVRLGPATLLL